MDTMAMYWEPRIKTYGFQIVRNLAVYTYRLRPDHLVRWGSTLESMQGTRNHFCLLCGQLNDRACVDLMVVCRTAHGNRLTRLLETDIPLEALDQGAVASPVELLFFHGPHFGDRPGIADFTYRALENHVDLLLASAFSCASIYLVFPQGAADAAKDSLAAEFRIPG